MLSLHTVEFRAAATVAAFILAGCAAAPPPDGGQAARAAAVAADAAQAQAGALRVWLDAETTFRSFSLVGATKADLRAARAAADEALVVYQSAAAAHIRAAKRAARAHRAGGWGVLPEAEARAQFEAAWADAWSSTRRGAFRWQIDDFDRWAAAVEAAAAALDEAALHYPAASAERRAKPAQGPSAPAEVPAPESTAPPNSEAESPRRETGG